MLVNIKAIAEALEARDLHKIQKLWHIPLNRMFWFVIIHLLPWVPNFIWLTNRAVDHVFFYLNVRQCPL